MSRTSSRNGLSSPFSDEMIETDPPQMSIAIAALTSPGRSSWNAASSIVILPCLPRMERGRDESASTLCPLAKSMRKALMAFFSPSSSASSKTNSFTSDAARLYAFAHIAHASMYSRVMSSE
jgi:hypothetical protein